VFQPTTFGKYFLTRRLAVGGMAEVFLAKLYGAEGFEKDLVIKQILPQHARDPEFVQSFVAEAKIAVSLNHANIVGIYELGRVDGTYFIAMEYVDGLDLFQVLESARKYNETVSPGLALLACEEVAKGLDYAHRKRGPDGQLLGLVHRDLNPRNVLVSKEGEVKILDFGIAKTASKAAEMPKTRAGVVKGTTGYMSPEQATGQDVDARTDIYQTGLLLHELLTGEALFWRPDEEVTRNLMRRHRVPAPSKSNPSLPGDLDQLCETCLSRQPSERPQTAADLAQRVARLRFLYFPDDDSRTLGSLVGRLVLLREEDVKKTELPPEMPNTVELTEVISQAIAHSISDDIETIATRFPSALSPAPGSTPLEVTSDQSVEATPAYGSERPAALESGVPPRSLAPPEDDVPVAPPKFPARESTSAAEITADAPSSGAFAPARPRARQTAAIGGLAAAGLVGLGLWMVGLGGESTGPSGPVAPSGPSAKNGTSPVPEPRPEAPAAERSRAVRASGETREPVPDAPGERPTDPGGGPDPQTEPTEAADRARRVADVSAVSSSVRSRARALPPSSEPAMSTVAFGTRSCSSRVTVDGQVVTRSTPSYDHRLPAGRHRIVVEGTSCPPVERPGSLRRVVPVVVSEVDLPPDGTVRIIADFERDRLIVKRR